MSEQPTRFTCFHCWEHFDASTLAGQRAARDHFGWTVHAEPACQIKRDERRLVFRIRAQEEQLARYRAQDSDSDRAHYALQADYARALKRAEEEGFARGVADMQKHGWQLKETA